jgi:hypothetical protein
MKIKFITVQPQSFRIDQRSRNIFFIFFFSCNTLGSLKYYKQKGTGKPNTETTLGRNRRQRRRVWHTRHSQKTPTAAVHQ